MAWDQLLLSTAENTAQKQQISRPFEPGQSGNPAGRPKGSRKKATLAVEVLLDGEAGAITRTAIELAKKGDLAAIRLCLDRKCAPTKRPSFPLRATGSGQGRRRSRGPCGNCRVRRERRTHPSEAGELSKVVDTYARALLAGKLEDRVAALESEHN
jgi:hypothetical protein